MERRRVVITGMGVLAPNGNNVEEFWKANVAGASGVTHITRFDPSVVKVQIAGEVKNFDPEQYMNPGIYRKLDRFGQLGVAASKDAVEDSGLTSNGNIPNPYRAGVVIGTGLGGLLFHEEQMMAAVEKKKLDWIASSCVPRISPNSVSSYIAMQFAIKGPNYAISTACSSGTNAIGQALSLLRNGSVDICIAGGVEAPLTPFTFAAYQNMRALSRRNSRPEAASRPFDKERDGFVLSEGAATLVLETLENALKRNAKIYAEVLGFGTNCGAYNMVAPQPDGLDAAQAIQAALEDAGIGKEKIDYINAHGTATPFNDIAETKAIKEVFGKRAYEIPISSTKSMIGHTIGASGAIAAVVCALVIQRQMIPPTINLDTPDPECDLDYVPKIARKAEVKIALSNSFGFGSNNAVLILRNYNGAGGD